ncbi:unnamed protein product [Staurois parvus]|uniref:Uncharacterized protein n=1 Tax=Staurois parvus TaxID=386267 RepID=A0ABN9E297_9NEOB|nr:unnamed protein product [Staurois parvus]
MQGLGRADIMNAGSRESGYSKCRVRGRPDIVNAGSGESGYSECRVRGEIGYSKCPGGSGESGYNECCVRGEHGRDSDTEGGERGLT